jgi:hypothetical protein
LTDERGVSLPLKNGNSIKVGIGQAYLRMLESLLEENLSSFEVLVKIAQGDESERSCLMYGRAAAGRFDLVGRTKPMRLAS